MTPTQRVEDVTKFQFGNNNNIYVVLEDYAELATELERVTAERDSALRREQDQIILRKLNIQQNADLKRQVEELRKSHQLVHFGLGEAIKENDQLRAQLAEATNSLNYTLKYLRSPEDDSAELVERMIVKAIESQLKWKTFPNF